MILLFTYITFVILYGIARATQQATLFNYRDKIQNPEWIDETSEIHWFGWFEPISIVLATLTFTKLGIFDWWFVLVTVFCSYSFYFLPYGIVFNRIRGRKWFNVSSSYKFKLFNIEIETGLPGLLFTNIAFYLSILLLIFVYSLIIS